MLHIVYQASFLSTLGGSNITAQSNKILRYLLTNELACNYNFVGQRQNNKTAFSNLKLKSVIIRKLFSLSGDYL